ncbi:MAG TPA: pilus assembly PilX N-terminal domain-containing protein [Candidatus Paceibacterota bacterium]
MKTEKQKKLTNLKTFKLNQSSKARKLTSSQASAGFTLLFASLIGALVIAVGLAILNITLKQLTLASAGKQSQRAFYSADSGIECALYLDRGAGNVNCPLGVFRTPAPDSPSGATICGIDSSGALPLNIECFGKHILVIPYENSNYAKTDHFYVANDSTQGASSGTNADMCFDVYVTKKIDDPGISGDESETVIESRGYSTCTVTTNKFERAIRTVNK